MKLMNCLLNSLFLFSALSAMSEDKFVEHEIVYYGNPEALKITNSKILENNQEIQRVYKEYQKKEGPKNRGIIFESLSHAISFNNSKKAPISEKALFDFLGVPNLAQYSDKNNSEYLYEFKKENKKHYFSFNFRKGFLTNGGSIVSISKQSLAFYHKYKKGEPKFQFKYKGYAKPVTFTFLTNKGKPLKNALFYLYLEENGKFKYAMLRGTPLNDKAQITIKNLPEEFSGMAKSKDEFYFCNFTNKNTVIKNGKTLLKTPETGIISFQFKDCPSFYTPFVVPYYRKAETGKYKSDGGIGIFLINGHEFTISNLKAGIYKIELKKDYKTKEVIWSKDGIKVTAGKKTVIPPITLTPKQFGKDLYEAYLSRKEAQKKWERQEWDTLNSHEYLYDLGSKSLRYKISYDDYKNSPSWKIGEKLPLPQKKAVELATKEMKKYLDKDVEIRPFRIILERMSKYNKTDKWMYLITFQTFSNRGTSVTFWDGIPVLMTGKIPKPEIIERK